MRRVFNGTASEVDADGFTLIELLVVVAIIGLLMAILLPTLSRIRRQARAVVCQSNLRQWGVMFYAYTNDNDRRFFSPPIQSGYPLWCAPMEPFYRHAEDLLFCPMATRHRTRPNVSPDWGGGRHSAWDLRAVPQFCVAGSYGLNGWIGTVPGRLASAAENRLFWQMCPDRRPHEVPVLLDAMFGAGTPDSRNPPPDPEDVHPPRTPGGCMMGHFSVNRHDGCVNGLFMDWSVRRVGVKELWTLRWQPAFETAGPWTEAGRVQPGDWPHWMSGFRDY